MQVAVAEQREAVHEQRGDRRQRERLVEDAQVRPRPRSSFVLITSPSETARLARISAAKPAARLVIQNR
jgi:hypothetical protein